MGGSASEGRRIFQRREEDLPAKGGGSASGGRKICQQRESGPRPVSGTVGGAQVDANVGMTKISSLIFDIIFLYIMTSRIFNHFNK
jgi:hypothetical protein